MTDEEKKAIDDLFPLTHINGYINLYDLKKANIYTSDLKKWQNGVKVLLNLIEKQDKIIDEMAKYWQSGFSYCEDCDRIIEDYDSQRCETCIKEYFKKKVEENKC